MIIWDSKTFQKVKEVYAHNDLIIFVKYSNDGKMLYTYGDNLIKIWNS